GGAAVLGGSAGATWPPPRAAELCDDPPADGRAWRIAHLSDVHVVGERYGFRLESGRSGPCGNRRLRRLLAGLGMLHAGDPLDALVVGGGMTDAGRSPQGGEVLDVVSRHSRLAERMGVSPRDPDLNSVHPGDPARLDLPTSPNKRLRKLRVLSAMWAVQGERVRVVDRAGGRLGATLASTLKPHLKEMARFADVGRPWLSKRLTELWTSVFPMVLPPDSDDGLGIILLDSNADTHFSFTNALGMISADQACGLDIARAQYPRACWVVALPHHVVEYPRAAKALSERVGTALINGNWFVRRLKPLAGRAVLMHGHRHIDWIGECGGIPILSAPSPVMEVTDEAATCFYI